MARRRRRDLPGDLYHVTVRGNNGRGIFPDDDDHRLFLGILRDVAETYGWVVYHYCLMGNHVHLLVRATQPALSSGMRELVGGFARASNRRHARTEHVFGSRFFAAPVLTIPHAMAVCRYIVVNPVRAGMCRDASDWAWSSFREVCGLRSPLHGLDVRWTHRLFALHRDDFAAFVRADPGGSGGDRPDLADLLRSDPDADDVASARAYGHTVGEIADHFELGARALQRRLRVAKACGTNATGARREGVRHDCDTG